MINDINESRKNFIKIAMHANDFEKALEFLNKWIEDGIARNGYFDDDEIYWLRLQAKYSVKSDDELITLGVDVSEDSDYVYAIAFSDDTLKAQRTRVMEKSIKEKRNREYKSLKFELIKELSDEAYDEALKKIKRILEGELKEVADCDGDLYWFRLLAKNNVKSDDELIALGVNFSKDKDYLLAIKHSPTALKAQRIKVMDESKNVLSQRLLEEKRIKEAKEAEEKRIAEENRKAEEERRIAEEKRKLEEAKKEAELKRKREEAKLKVIGDTLYFGSYPQTLVTNQAICSALTAEAGKLPTTRRKNAWTSYRYYSNYKKRDYMWYIDKEYGGEKYRGVYFVRYRPSCCWYRSLLWNTYRTNQRNLGYHIFKVYWFKYEQIKWKLLKENGEKAFICADLILDSQPYDNDRRDNYAKSTIRAWLNDTFYNTAFNTLQKKIIQTRIVDNSAASSGHESNRYACENTDDKAFLLSNAEVTNSRYGFSSSHEVHDVARQKKSSDYARCQGGEGSWWLRSIDPNSSTWRGGSMTVINGGIVGDNIVFHANGGIVPAMVIRLS